MFGRIQALGRKQVSHGAEGARRLEAGDYAEAETHLSRALADAEQHRSAPATQILLRLQLAEAQRKLEKFDQAKQTLEGAIVCTAREGNAAAYVECLDALAGIFDDAGDFAGAHKLLEEAGRVEATLPHPDHKNVARRTRRMGVARHKMGQDAGALLEKAVTLYGQVFGAENLETGDLLTELGVIYRGQGKHADAQRCLQRAVKIHENVCGPDSKEALRDLQLLAKSFEESGDQEAAAARYERLLKQIQFAVGCNMDEVAETQCRIARSYVRWGNHARARELLNEAAGTFGRTKGPRMAGTLETLAHVEELSGHLRSAIGELERAAAIWEAGGDQHRADLARNMAKRAELYTHLQETDEARWLRETAATLRDQSPEDLPAESH
jgi:tetratricopeptide (TPR) repeat protein